MIAVHPVVDGQCLRLLQRLTCKTVCLRSSLRLPSQVRSNGVASATAHLTSATACYSSSVPDPGPNESLTCEPLATQARPCEDFTLNVQQELGARAVSKLKHGSNANSTKSAKQWRSQYQSAYKYSQPECHRGESSATRQSSSATHHRLSLGIWRGYLPSTYFLLKR